MARPQSKAVIEALLKEGGSKRANFNFEAFIAPNVNIYVNGQFREQGLYHIQKHHNARWATSPEKEIKVLEVRELQSQDAVQVKAVDTALDKVITTTYYFGEVNGAWLVIKLDGDYDPNTASY